MTDITVSSKSRYKDTPVFDDLGGAGPQFGLFTPPAEFVTGVSSWRVHTVRSHEVGMLDRLAVTYFGQDSEMLWWAIAVANGIVDTEYDMYPGQRLYIPPSSVASAFMRRGTRY